MQKIHLASLKPRKVSGGKYRLGLNLKSSPWISKTMIIVMVLLGCFSISAQNVSTITGHVMYENEEAVIGATVRVVGSQVAMSTDLDGNFSLPAKKGDSIEVTYIGCIPAVVKITDQKHYEVILKEDTKVLDEVVVTGYGAVSKKNLTTAISKIKADEVNKVGVSNMSQMLMGRAAGLNATLQSAQPGGGVNVTIRGGGTPIYVIDGMVMPSNSLEGGTGGTMTTMPLSVNRSGLQGLNPEDIESIEVLKDASASIYGIGAANGVILITTKKGKEGKVKVTYNGSFSMVRNYHYLDMLEADDFMNYSNGFGMERYLYQHKQGFMVLTLMTEVSHLLFHLNRLLRTLSIRIGVTRC